MTPRPYLSYSQLTLLERSPNQYRKVYIEGDKGFTSHEMSFGSKIAELLERDEFSGNPTEDLMLSQVPKEALPEHEIYALLVAGNKTVPLIAKPDSISIDYLSVLEYKTGRGSWSQSKVDNASQLTFYATVVWILKKQIPALELVWIETEEGPEGTRFTGKIRRFKTKRDMGDILRMQKRMFDAWDTIKNMTHEALV